MYAVAQAVVERDDEKSGVVEPGGGLADFLRFFLFGHSCSLSRFARMIVRLRRNDDLLRRMMVGLRRMIVRLRRNDKVNFRKRKLSL